MATAPFRSIGPPLPILLMLGVCPLPSVRNITSGWMSLVESLRKTESEPKLSKKKKCSKFIPAKFTWMKDYYEWHTCLFFYYYNFCVEMDENAYVRVHFVFAQYGKLYAVTMWHRIERDFFFSICWRRLSYWPDEEVMWRCHERIADTKICDPFKIVVFM